MVCLIFKIWQYVLQVSRSSQLIDPGGSVFKSVIFKIIPWARPVKSLSSEYDKLH